MSNRIKDLTMIALMAVVITVCSWIAIPFAVPITLQTFGVCMALRLLGGVKGTAAVGLYILLGAVGVPVFAGFTGGLGHLFGPTGGYIFGFAVMGALYIAAERILPDRKGFAAGLIRLSAALLACWATGTLWFALQTASGNRADGIRAALLTCVVPFIIPDAVKLVLAQLLGGKIKKKIQHF